MKKTKVYRKTCSKIICGAISILGFLLLWQAAVSLTGLGKIMPGPAVILNAFFRSFVEEIAGYTVLGHIFWSLSRVLVGYILACLLGITLGLLMGRFRLMEAIFNPFYEMIRPIPPIAWISLAILWFGIGESMTYFIIFLATFNVLTINVYRGYESFKPGAGRLCQDAWSKRDTGILDGCAAGNCSIYFCRHADWPVNQLGGSCGSRDGAFFKGSWLFDCQRNGSE